GTRAGHFRDDPLDGLHLGGVREELRVVRPRFNRPGLQLGNEGQPALLSEGSRLSHMGGAVPDEPGATPQSDVITGERGLGRRAGRGIDEILEWAGENLTGRDV